VTSADPLYELLVALFDSDSELRRFLNLAGLEEVEHRLPVTKGGSTRATAAEASATLQSLGLVQAPLFEALARRAPERAADIWDVARTYGIESGETGAEPVSAPASAPSPAVDEPSPASRPLPPLRADVPEYEQAVEPDEEPLPAGYAKYLEQLDSELAKTVELDPEQDALAPSRWPWTAASAVLGSFRPRELEPLRGFEGEDSALTALADVVFTTADGRWVLEDAVRSQALQRLDAENALLDALDANAERPDSHRDWIRRLVALEPLPRLATLDTRELSVLETVVRWLDPLSIELTVGRADIYATIERRSLIDPLRKLVGAHFRGRAGELERVDRHIRGLGNESTMVIRGPGGSGKSSLLGKVLLELEDRIADEPVSFAYVDFDKARHNPGNALGLVEQIARQLRLLYAANVETSRDFSSVEALSAGTDFELAAEVLELDTESARLDVDGLIRELCVRLDRLPRATPTPLVLILDTFEEVQIRGPGAVEGVLDLMKRFQEALPGMRLIVSGRGSLSPVVREDSDSVVTLGDLDSASAHAVLESLGVTAPDIRTLIYTRFGGNPLTLHLAAEALQRMGTAEKAFDGVLGQADALATIGIQQIQGMLYDRILGHLRDFDVGKVALPGLAVRRVDVDVIREVLAGPCKLDPSRAEEIFERLQLEVTMFDLEDDGALRHRQDVRRLMLRAMTDDPKAARTVAEIHRLAVAFYKQRAGDTARVEEIYHRLMAGEDPRSLDWDPKLRDAFYSALEDPLPDAARTWLSRRLGLVDADVDRAEWEQEDWEAEAAERARSWLASGDATRAAEVLAERSYRLPGSPLYPLDVAALIDLQRFDEASQALDEGMRSSIEAHAVQTQLELAEQGVRLAASQNDAAGIVAATESAVALADLADEKLRGISDLAGSVDTLQLIGASDEADRLAESMSRRFSSLSANVLRDNPLLVRTVVESVGSTDSSVLARAAVSVGDVMSEQDGLFRDDVYALTRVLESTVPEGRSAMNDLAMEVGLGDDRWTTFELASSAVQRGRTGEAVVLALDYAAEESTTRQMIVDGLVRRLPTS
jgi:hypothetical protein